MLQVVFDYFRTNPTWPLAITILSTAMIWLYKEFKVMLENDNKNKLALVQKNWIYIHQ
ncbi:hypothetical protein [Paenibacillus monticola]|uniref:Uncharacterized protein n=1 Tax=Paenibacillus monticola TaxID=2666075 RepID=A0A7X2HB20_9BACL|nr:hypothetical protein [Paenibacillus monticola]MRN56745.1 hypothetical protein [Paenibacillus monticola]